MLPARGRVARFVTPRVESAVHGSVAVGLAERALRARSGLPTMADDVTAHPQAAQAGVRCVDATPIAQVTAPPSSRRTPRTLRTPPSPGAVRCGAPRGRTRSASGEDRGDQDPVARAELLVQVERPPVPADDHGPGAVDRDRIQEPGP